jgi:hypothetical protein
MDDLGGEPVAVGTGEQCHDVGDVGRLPKPTQGRDRRRGELQGHVVEEDVQAAEVLVGDNPEIVDRVGVGKVDPHAMCAPAGVPDLLLDLRGTLNATGEMNTTVAPSTANHCTIARLIPRDPPVTTAHLPSHTPLATPHLQ